jgi:glutamyl-Q tRNA(Asp) synthetase
VHYQSQHRAEYEAALDRLRATGRTYACDCTRARLRTLRHVAGDEPRYDGRCRHRDLPGERHALRMHVDAPYLDFDDGGLGPQACALQSAVGDFVLRRRDGIPGYQLACAVDEQIMGITEVVRGADLLASTFRQLHILDALGWQRPAYRHLPVLVDRQGCKLSKQNHAPPIAQHCAGRNLFKCLQWLGQQPPAELLAAPASALTAWALAHWQPGRIPRTPCIEVEQTP